MVPPSYLVKGGTWFVEYLMAAVVLKNMAATWQQLVETLFLTLLALALASSTDMAKALADSKVCEYEFAHQGNIFFIHSWLLKPSIITTLSPLPRAFA